MPWKEATAMSERTKFVEQAHLGCVNFSRLCQTYGISRTTGYKWLQRFAAEGIDGLQERSRRPQHSPKQTPAEVENAILHVRFQHPSWGGVKILAYLRRQGWNNLPSASTATAVLRRNGMIDPQEACKHRPVQRFEHAAPNELWQMDFKGYIKLDQGFCHPLTILDDHSRFLVGLHACPNHRWQTVQLHLTHTFRAFGLPERMLMDNGSPWGDDRQSKHTVLTAWLMRLGVAISHGRPYHPQTQGKDERLHRTFQAELLNQRDLHTLSECQDQFDGWRDFYNLERPHQALGQSVPAERYYRSPRLFPEVLPPVVYDSGLIVRKVDKTGLIYFQNRRFHVSKAFRHSPVALHPADIDGVFDVFFCQFKVAQIDVRGDNC